VLVRSVDGTPAPGLRGLLTSLNRALRGSPMPPAGP